MKVKITRARGAFLDVIKAVQYQGQGSFYWGGTLLCVPGETMAQLATGQSPDGKTLWGNPQPAKAAIDKALEEVAKAKWAQKWATHLPNILPDMKACAWVDGNRREYDGYQGNWALSFKRYTDDGRMLLIDADRSPIVQPDGEFYPGKEGRLYSGCYLNATVELWAQENKFGKGLRCQVQALQFAGDGDAFGGGARPNADDFDEIAQSSGAGALA